MENKPRAAATHYILGRSGKRESGILTYEVGADERMGDGAVRHSKVNGLPSGCCSEWFLVSTTQDEDLRKDQDCVTTYRSRKEN